MCVVLFKLVSLSKYANKNELNLCFYVTSSRCGETRATLTTGGTAYGLFRVSNTFAQPVKRGSGFSLDVSGSELFLQTSTLFDR